MVGEHSVTGDHFFVTPLNEYLTKASGRRLFDLPCLNKRGLFPTWVGIPSLMITAGLRSLRALGGMDYYKEYDTMKSGYKPHLFFE